MAVGEEELLVEESQLDRCGECRPYVGEREGAFLKLRPFEPPPDMSLQVLLLTFLIYAPLLVSFAYGYSNYTNYSFVSALSLFLVGSLTPLLVQSLLTLSISWVKGSPLRLYLFPAPSPLPSLMPAFVHTRPFKDLKEQGTVYSVPLLLGVLSAVIIAFFSQSALITVLRKPAKEVVYLLPPLFHYLSGPVNPVALGALAYLLSAFFQTTLYPFSPSWAVLGIRSRAWWLPLLLWLVIAYYDKVMGQITAGYALTSSLLSLYFQPLAPLENPLEGPSWIGIVSLITSLLLAVPVKGFG